MGIAPIDPNERDVSELPPLFLVAYLGAVALACAAIVALAYWIGPIG